MQHQMKVRRPIWQQTSTFPSFPPPFPFAIADASVPTPTPHLAGSLVAQFLRDGMEGFQVGSFLLAGGKDDSVRLPAKQNNS